MRVTFGDLKQVQDDDCLSPRVPKALAEQARAVLASVIKTPGQLGEFQKWVARERPPTKWQNTKKPKQFSLLGLLLFSFR